MLPRDAHLPWIHSSARMESQHAAHPFPVTVMSAHRESFVFLTMTKAELFAEEERVCALPKNRSPAGSLWLYVPSARRKLDAIRRQITHLLGEERAMAGDPVQCDGYSGRQTNRRK